MHKNLPIPEGVAARLEFPSIIAPEGADTALLGAASNADRLPVPFELAVAPDGSPALVIPPTLPVGLWPYEVRCGGHSVLHGHIHILPSPLADNEGHSVFSVSVDLSTTILQVSITFSPGPRGPMGPQGPQGEQGPQGPQGEQGPAPSQADIAAALSSTVTADTPSGNSNSNIRTAILPAAYARTGKLLSVTIRSRNSGTTGIADSPVWLFVQQEDANGSWHDIGYSSAPVQQTVNADSTWLFDSLPVQADRRIGLITRADTSGSISTLGVRLSTGAADTAAVVDGGGTMQAAQLLQCSLAYAVTTAMPLSAQQYADLLALLARKDDLLALLPS